MALAGKLNYEQLQNVANYIRRSVNALAGTAKALERATRRKGRCPKAKRSWLKTQLETISTPIAVEPRAAISSPAGTEVLDLSDSSWSIDQLPSLLDRIGQARTDTKTLEIRLGGFTYATTLAVLAQWILAQGLVGRYRVKCPPQMDRYLERISFDRALKDREIRISPDFMDWAVGLTRINRDLPTEKVTKKIVDIIDTFVTPEPEVRQALHILLGEMIENVHRHASAEVDGFAVAQVYPQRLKMGIALVDAGIGVRRSLAEGEPPIEMIGHNADEQALRKACELYVTSKPSRHSGYGLYLLRETVARNRGTFALSSGAATITGYLRNQSTVIEAQTHAPWQGTIVNLILDLHQSLPILDVYGAMPAPEGYDTDDLFVD